MLEEEKQALAIRESLARTEPEVTAYRNALGDSFYDIALTFSQTGRFEESLAAFEQARKIQTTPVGADPSAIRVQRSLAVTYTGIGFVLSHQTRTREAPAAFEQARVIQQKVVESNPNVSLFQSDLSRIYNNIGMQLHELGRTQDALVAMERGQAIRQALTEKDPGVTTFQHDLVLSFLAIADLHRIGGQIARSASAYLKSLELLERLPSLSANDQFNVTTAHAGLAALADLPGPGRSAEEARRESDLAMLALRIAIEGGYRSPQRIWSSPQFSAFKLCQDFRLLMMDLAFPSDPFAQAE